MGTTTPIHDALTGDRLEVPVPPPGSGPTVAEDAEAVIALAWQEAHERGHACFGTGHLLLGLVRAGGTEAGLLAAAGVTPSMADAAMALVVLSSVSEPVVTVETLARIVPSPTVRGGPVAGESVAEVLRHAARTATDGVVTASAVLAALAARPWGQAAEMFAALGVDAVELAAAGATLAARAPDVDAAPRPTPRDPSGLLSTAWRAPRPEQEEELAEA
ncbi:Clp protease N-terminal domain-containing protein [Actinomycetospora aeridis]|uniref:Clp protease N-terminal domain-containing protein n=1 Tax=Actinomycetospora aeridis TaxID=3129231 RepID=A0ABU8N6K1_9PSEU